MDEQSGITDGVTVAVNDVVQQLEVKGPDPDVWGDDHCVAADPETGVPVDYEVKGPDVDEWSEAQAYADAVQAARHQPDSE